MGWQALCQTQVKCPCNLRVRLLRAGTGKQGVARCGGDPAIVGCAGRPALVLHGRRQQPWHVERL